MFLFGVGLGVQKQQTGGVVISGGGFGNILCCSLGFLLFRLLVYLQNSRKAEVHFENKIACSSYALGPFFSFLLCIFLLYGGVFFFLEGGGGFIGSRL